jgi:predicted esterase YcpF (UPF0227 family)
MVCLAAVEQAQRLARMAALGLGDLFWCAAAAFAAGRDRPARQISAAATPVTVVGSSLGGYYATHLAEAWLRAVLVNLAWWRTCRSPSSSGRRQPCTGEAFDFKPEYIEELRAIEVPRISRPQDVLMLAETGDEVLDYREAVAKYAGCRQVVLEGGDHSFTRWDDYLDAILEFAGLLT